MQPALSIIIPVYNASQYLPACLDSILQQSYQDFEVLLVNDGSKDDSADICLKYANKDSRFRYYYQDNAGPGSARNLGLTHSQGRYITFVDADDEIGDNPYQNIDFLENDAELSFVQFPVIRRENNSKEFQMIPKRSEYLCGRNEICREWCTGTGKILVALWNKIFRREAFDDIVFPIEYHYGDDAYVMCRILPHINKIYFSEIGTYYYYRREGSIATDAEGTFSENLAALYLSMWRLQMVLSMPGLISCRSNASLIYINRIVWAQYYAKNESLKEFYQFANTLVFPWREILEGDLSIKLRLRMFIIKIIGVRAYVSLIVHLKKRLAGLRAT